jgi:Tfp pilus assembly protein PilF
MDPAQIDTLVQRLLANPHDEEALSSAHQAGASDPKSYALFLERVGAETVDAAYASHWLSEAGNVWSSTLGDAHRAARVLMQAIERDPTQRTAAERLAQLYRDKGDAKPLAALLQRRVKALGPLAAQSADIRAELASMHEELGRLFADSLQDSRRALENFRRAIDLDPASAYALYGAREIYKSLGQWNDVIQMYEAELAIEHDPQRQLALLREEAAARRTANDLRGASQTLARARQIDEQDAALQQEFASLIVERLAAGEEVSTHERTVGAELLVGLAELYDGEHGFAYSGGALDIQPGHDRALQLYAHYAQALDRREDLAGRYLAYVEANPGGAMAADARWLLSASYESAAQIDHAIQVLEPLRRLGDEHATAKLRELYAQQGRPMPSASPPQPPARAEAQAHAMAVPTPAAMAHRDRGAVAVDKLQALLDSAQALAETGMRAEACAKYRELLESDPAHPEALSWVEDYLRTQRDYASLREVLLAAVRAPGIPVEARKERLREVAGLSEGNLRDIDGAIQAWRQLLALDRSEDGARQSLARLLEKAQRWDDLANLLEQEATAEGDLEKKIALEKKLATMQEQKRQDFAAAADAWGRIANLTPEDDRAVATASQMFEKAGAVDRAAQVIAENAAAIQDAGARAVLMERLGLLRERLHDSGGSGEAYADAAEVQKSATLWEAAERGFVEAERWARAARAARARADMADDTVLQAESFARAADFLGRAGDDAGALANLERAADLDPGHEQYARLLMERYTGAQKWGDLAHLLVARGERLTDKGQRIALRRQAAKLYAGPLADQDRARETWRKILDDGEDQEALERLVDDAVGREDYAEATGLLHRLGEMAVGTAERLRIALREAELLADGVGDVDTAIACYERVLAELDPTSRPALQAITDLEEARDNPAAAANALERELAIVVDAAERGAIAGRAARLYELMGDPKNAIRALEIVRTADPEDFDSLIRLCDLCEKSDLWDKLADLLAQRIEIEADETEASVLTAKLAGVLSEKLDRGDEGLATLTELADAGDPAIRAAYIELGDRLGWRGIVATKLVEWWFEALPGPERLANLRGAFERFAAVGRDEDAVRVACEITRGKGGDAELAGRLEELAIKTGELDALSVAHGLLAHDLTGYERASELVRQAEVRVAAGAPRLESLEHGEGGLTSVAPADAEELLARLASIAEKPGDVVDLYERQISRCKTPADRLHALARAAQVADSKGQLDRARGFFDLALSGTPSEETLAALDQSAAEADRRTGTQRLQRALVAAMAHGGQGARDGGKTRGSLMRRAASMAHRDLDDPEQAFTWLGDALIAHVDPLTLDALESLADEIGDPRRAEATLGRALGEVFDGPLVRQLLTRRAKLRLDHLDDRTGAAADLKKLHDLVPNDLAVMDELTALLGSLGDYRAMVHLFEDQILRGKDMSARAELARKVAQMWEEQLADPREAADAWRRVLRMKQGDPEATSGLERAKSNMLRRPEAEEKPEPEAERPIATAPPPLPNSPPPPLEVEPVSATLRAARLAGTGTEGDTPSGAEDPLTAAPRASADEVVVEGEATALAPLDSAIASAREAVEVAPTSAGEERAMADDLDGEHEDEVIVADDLVEMIDTDDEAVPSNEETPEDESPKRVVPPPIPHD